MVRAQALDLVQTGSKGRVESCKTGWQSGDDIDITGASLFDVEAAADIDVIRDCQRGTTDRHRGQGTAVTVKIHHHRVAAAGVDRHRCRSKVDHAVGRQADVVVIHHDVAGRHGDSAQSDKLQTGRARLERAPGVRRRRLLGQQHQRQIHIRHLQTKRVIGATVDTGKGIQMAATENQFIHRMSGAIGQLDLHARDATDAEIAAGLNETTNV